MQTRNPDEIYGKIITMEYDGKNGLIKSILNSFENNCNRLELLRYLKQFYDPDNKKHILKEEPPLQKLTNLSATILIPIISVIISIVGIILKA